MRPVVQGHGTQLFHRQTAADLAHGRRACRLRPAGEAEQSEVHQEGVVPAPGDGRCRRDLDAPGTCCRYPGYRRWWWCVTAAAAVPAVRLSSVRQVLHHAQVPRDA